MLRNDYSAHTENQNLPIARILCVCLMTWWLLRGAYTRSHTELGRENPQRL
jgi:hypothetical protein